MPLSFLPEPDHHSYGSLPCSDLSLIVILSYLFNIIVKKLKIPSVLVVVLTGLLMMFGLLIPHKKVELEEEDLHEVH